MRFSFSVLFLALFLTFTAVSPFAAEKVSAKTEAAATAGDATVQSPENDLPAAPTIENLQQLPETKMLDAQAEKLSDQYDAWLKYTGLIHTTTGKIVLSVGMLGLWLLMFGLVRTLSHWADRRLKFLQHHYHLQHNRFRIYTRIARSLMFFFLGVISIYTIGSIWGLTSWNVIGTETTVLVLGVVLHFALLSLMGVVFWEILSGVIEYALRRADESSSNRARTLLPVLRNMAFMVFACLFGLVVLADLGVNIIPLLAGAGIVGVAIGFGAQAMVKDFLTGITVVLEDAIRVGEVAKLGDRTGVIEKISLRKVQLRDAAGTIFSVPFSDIKIIENYTRDHSSYVFEIPVAYTHNTDTVFGIMRAISDELQADAVFAEKILAPIDIWGVDRFTDDSVIIKAAMKTQPGQQWAVGREFNRRLKFAFDAQGIWFSNPTYVEVVNKNAQETASV